MDTAHDYNIDVLTMLEGVLRTKFNSKRQFTDVFKFLGLVVQLLHDRIIIFVSVERLQKLVYYCSHYLTTGQMTG